MKFKAFERTATSSVRSSNAQSSEGILCGSFARTTLSSLSAQGAYSPSDDLLECPPPRQLPSESRWLFLNRGSTHPQQPAASGSTLLAGAFEPQPQPDSPAAFASSSF